MDIIVDIDGTVADIEHRRHFVMNKPKNWKAFYAGMENDKPIPAMINLLHNLHLYDQTKEDDVYNNIIWCSTPNNIIWCTGRPEEFRDITQTWLKKQFLQMHHLYMRPHKDHRPDYIVKEELLQQMRKDGLNPIMAFEDRQQCVDMWRRNGLICAQVSEGNF